MKKQLFILDRNMLALVGKQATQDTYNDMKELGIANPPYDELTIQVPLGAVVQNTQGIRIDDMAAQNDGRAQRLKDAPLQIVYESGKFSCQVSDSTHKHWKSLDSFLYENMQLYALLNDHQKQMKNLASHIMALLIVLLATKNIHKTVSHNSLAKFGRGKQQYEYVTTLKVGVIYEDDGLPSQPTGMTRRPHLRRGHIRRQKYGPGFQYARLKFIRPIFVNGWMPDAHDDRIAYNVSLSREGA